MELRHAATIVLAGWYLLMPPWIGPTLDLRTPLSKWVNQGSFNSDEQCENARADLINGFKGDLDTAEGKAPDSEDVVMLQMADEAEEESECVATDDPHLKPKQEIFIFKLSRRPS
jgi:hypothetical protein